MSEQNHRVEAEPPAVRSQPLQPPEPEREPLPARLRYLNYLVLLPLLALATIFFGTVSLLCGLWDTTGRQQHAVARAWARVMLRVALSPMTLEHRERLQGGAAVYACNHLSYYDTPALFGTLPFQFRILANAPLWKVPFIGWYLNRSGQVPVDKSSARASVQSLMRGVKALEAGMPLVVFPEGGRAITGVMKPMVAGAAWMAIKAQVPVVPLTLVGTYELLPMRVYCLRPRPLKLIVGEPIPTTGMSTREAEALTARLKAVIHATYVKHNG